MRFVLNDKLGSFRFRTYTFLPKKVIDVINENDICDLLKNKKVKALDLKVVKTETIPIVEKKAKEGQLRIGALRVGGLGDTLQLGCHARAIKRKFPACFLTVYVRDKIAVEIMQYNKWIDKTIQVGMQSWDNIVDRESIRYDIFYDFRYVVKVIFNTDKFPKYKKQTEDIFEQYKKIYNNFCKSNYKLEKLNTNLIDFSNKTACLDGSENDLTFDLKNNFCGYARVMAKQKYITIHVSSGKYRITKSWNIERWQQIVKYLISLGYTIIQLGSKGEPVINNVVDLTGLSNIQETAWILHGSQFHIDTEGGLVHLAKAVNTQSIVIFGATPVECFGYKGNINIRDNSCSPCWYRTIDWEQKCPDGYETPICLDKISVDLVKEAINVFHIQFKDKKEIVSKIERPLVSIIIPVYNQLKYLKVTIDSILNNTKENIELIIIDNGSGNEVKEYLNNYKSSKMIHIITNDKNLGFGKANNQGAKRAQGKYLLFLNSDVKVSNDWLTKLLDGINEEKIGMVGVAGGRLDKNFRCTGIVRTNDASYNYLEGWCLLLEKQLFDDIGGWDERFFAFSEDADLSYRIKKCGYKLKIVEGVHIHHYRNRTVYNQNDFDVAKMSLESSNKLKIKIKSRGGSKNEVCKIKERQFL